MLRIVAVALAAVFGVAGWFAWQGQALPTTPATLAALPPAPNLPAKAPAIATLDRGAPAVLPTHGIGETVSAALAQTSLAGTQPDGGWVVDAQGRLIPGRAGMALRQRFDYYLSLVGELPPSRLRELVMQDAQQSLPADTVAAVLQLWDRYVRLQQFAWRTHLDLRQTSTWAAALQERQQVRRELLGADWAHAFFGDEERQFQHTLASLAAGGVPATSSTAGPVDPPVHPQAQHRLADVDAQWRQWDQRLTDARERVRALQVAPELSAPQRQQAIDQYLAAQFSAAEQLRAKLLLGL